MVALDMLVSLLRKPTVETLHKILALIAPKLGIGDEVGLHVLRRCRQFCSGLRRHELAGINTHRAIWNVLPEPRVDLGLRDVGEKFVGELLMLRAFRNRDHVEFDNLILPDDIEW